MDQPEGAAKGQKRLDLTSANFTASNERSRLRGRRRIESALRQARAVAGDRDIRVAGGADVIQQYLRAGLVDEFALAISPVMFGGGRRLFEAISREVWVELVETIASPRVTHVRYAGARAVRRRPSRGVARSSHPSTQTDQFGRPFTLAMNTRVFTAAQSRLLPGSPPRLRRRLLGRLLDRCLLRFGCSC